MYCNCKLAEFRGEAAVLGSIQMGSDSSNQSTFVLYSLHAVFLSHLASIVIKS